MKRILSFSCLVVLLGIGLLVSGAQDRVLAQTTTESCWCCVEGKVVQIPAADCKAKGGACYGSKDEAYKNCQKQ
jgi:hypothetical protein